MEEELQANPEEPQGVNPTPKDRPILKALQRIILWTLLVLLTIFLLFQIPAVQTWTVHRITKRLSKQLHTKVEVGYFRLGFFNRLVLEDVYVEDLDGDTLLFSKGLTASMNLSPLTLIRRGLVIQKLSLQESQLYIRRKPDEFDTNLKLLFSHLKDPDKEPKEKTGNFQLQLSLVKLGAFTMYKFDELKNQRQELGMESARIEVDDLDLANNSFCLKEVIIDGPRVSIDDHIRTPKWEDFLKLPFERDSGDLKVNADKVVLKNGVFSFHNYRKAPIKITPDSVIDYKHLELFDITLKIDEFQMHRDTFHGRLNCFTFQDSSGFELDDFSAKDVLVSPNKLELNGLQMQTPYSLVRDTLHLRYREYRDFELFTDRVIIDARLGDAKIAMRDVINFAPSLNGKSFFEKNRDQVVALNGRFLGTVNNLDGRNLDMALNDGSRVQFSFGSRDLAVPGDNALNFSFKRLNTYVSTLRNILPNFDVPDNFERLGTLNYRGRVDILFSDVVTTGVLSTDLGQADVDLKLYDMSLGKERTRYSGRLDLTDFDVGEWAQNKDLGKISLTSSVENGRGFTAASAFANLSANIKRFDFKDYTYQNASLTGVLNANQFDGGFQIKDQNIDFAFSGVIDASGDNPRFDFEAQIEKLDLEALNLSEKPLQIDGQIKLDLTNRTLADLVGTISLENVNLLQADEQVHLDQLNLKTFFRDDSVKVLHIDSDILEADLQGYFEVDRVPTYISQYLATNYAPFAQQLGINVPDSIMVNQEVKFDFLVKDSKGFQHLFFPTMSDIQGAKITGVFNNKDSILEAKLLLPNLEIGKARIQDLEVRFDADAESGSLDLGFGGISPNDKIPLAPLNLLSYFTADSLQFGLSYSNEAEKTMLQQLFFDGRLIVKDTNLLVLDMDNSKIKILDEEWQINNQNRIYFIKDSIQIEEFAAVQAERTADLTTFGKRGLQLSLSNLDLQGLNRQLNYAPLQFDGFFNANLKTSDIMELTNIEVSLGADSVIINGDDWGALELIGQMENAKEPMVAFLTMTNDTSQLLMDAIYNVADIGTRKEEQKGYFDANLNLQSFPIAFAEYFIGGTISESTGAFNARLRFNGDFEKPNIFGNIQMGPGGIKLNYLNTRYTFQTVDVVVDNYFFDASGAKLFDRFGNSAEVIGGIRHDHLSNMGFDARLYAERFLGLNTVKGDNDLFYGQGIGSAEIFFTGTFKQPDIYVNAVVGEGTKIAVPISSNKKASELSFIRFVDRDLLKLQADSNGKKTETYDLKGVSLEMDLVATQAAEIQIIFNEQVGDVIEGRGYGALRISVPRNGDYKMYGDYTINDGNYLFTLYNLVNKKFTVKKGGTISWNGDPYTANINLVASYSGLNTSVSNFIQEYLLGATSELKNDASEPTDIDLFLNLTGDLLRPTINFDIAFPSLQGEIATYAESKMRLLKQDQNELSKQVFGLIVAGQFIPGDVNLQGTEIIYNTVGEFLSNQLSLLLTELFSEFIGEGRTLSSVDFDIAYSQFQSVDLGEGQNINRGNELNLSLKQNFFNDRLSVQLGGNIDLDGSTRTAANSRSAFVGNDLKFEIEINEDRNLKLRIYQRLEPDIGGRKLEIGAGLSYRKEFDTFGEFLRSFREKKPPKN